MIAKTLTGKATRAVTIYSTSEARANFAEALESANKDGAVIGFDRYGHTVAALVPLEAIYLLAGRGQHIAPAMRERIERRAKNLVQDILKQPLQLKRETKAEPKILPRFEPRPKLRTRPKRKRRSNS